MALPVLESGWTTATTGGSTASTLVINAPSSIAVGDLLLVISGSDDTASGAGFSALTGDTFTKFDDRDTGNGAKLAGYWRIADGTEGASWTINANSNDELWGWAGRFSNVDGTTPVYITGIAVGTVSNSTNHSKTNGAVSANPDNLSFTAFAFDGGDGVPFVLSASGAWGDNTHLTDIQSGTSGNDASGMIATASYPWIMAGVSRPIGITSSVSDGSNYFAICIQSGDPPTPLNKALGIAIATVSSRGVSSFWNIPSQQAYNFFGIPMK